MNRALAVMLIASNLTYGGYEIIASGMTWTACRALLARFGTSAYYDHTGAMRVRECVAEGGETET